MESEQREHVVEAVERWCREQFQQPWARTVTIKPLDETPGQDATRYEVWVEIPDTPDWITLSVAIGPHGDIEIQQQEARTP